MGHKKLHLMETMEKDAKVVWSDVDRFGPHVPEEVVTYPYCLLHRNLQV